MTHDDSLNSLRAIRTTTASRLLDMPVPTLTKLIREGKLPAYKVGRSYRIRLSDLQAVFGEGAERDR